MPRPKGSPNKLTSEIKERLSKVIMDAMSTIDMEHLSSATYIVNALDTETNERLSYKVIKH